MGRGTPGFFPGVSFFITQDFLDRFFPDPERNYVRQLGNAARVMGLSLVGLDLNESASEISRQMGEIGVPEDRFVTGYINGPVSRLIDVHGFVKGMVAIRKQPDLFLRTADGFLRYVEACVKRARECGLMAIAVADDIAGNNGLLFSLDYFVDSVCPVYASAARIIKESRLFTFFHSDGDMRKVVEFLIQAGYDCIHPVDVQGGLDLYSLRQEYGERVAFMGHLDVMTWDAQRLAAELDRAGKTFVGGGLILGSMGGISMDVKSQALRALYPGLQAISSGDGTR